MLVRELLVRLGVVDGKQATAVAEKFDAALSEVKKTATQVVAITTAFVGTLGAVTLASAQAGDAAAKGAQRAALQAEAYQELGFAADRSGVSIEQLETAMKRQALVAGQTAQGTGEAKDAYKALGISVVGSTGALKSQEQLLYETADALAGVTNDTERAALASRIFGESGANLLPLLNQGSAGIEALRLEARELGFVLDEEATRRSEQFIDSLTDLKAIGVGLRNIIGSALIPVVTEIAHEVREWYIANKEVIEQKLEVWVGKLTAFVQSAREEVARITEVMGGWEKTLGFISKAVGALAAAWAAFRAGKAIYAIGAAFTALSAPIWTSIGIIAAVVAWFGALYLVLEDIWTFVTGGKSVTGEFLESLGLDEETLAAVNRLLDAARGLAGSLGELLNLVASRIASALGIDAQTALELFNALLKEAGKLLWDLAGGWIEVLIWGLNGVAGILEGWTKILDGIIAKFDELVALAVKAGNLAGGIAGMLPGGGVMTLGMDLGADLAAGALTGSGGGGGGNVSNSTSSFNAVFNGLGMSPEEAQALVESLMQGQQQQSEDDL